ncbi:MAG: flagellar protein FliS [Proteobacteria bacterium]|nr:flagellar protein FliS [Pseudomonadota bacterium]
MDIDNHKSDVTSNLISQPPIRSDKKQALFRYENALQSIDMAKKARKMDMADMASDHIHEAIKVISMMNHVETTENLSNLFVYMIDRLTIHHSTSHINPLDEIAWLLKSLQEFYTKKQAVGYLHNPKNRW